MLDMQHCDLSRWSGDTDRCRWCDGPLTGRSRAWCSKLCARAYSENHVWSAARQAALDESGYSCAECGTGLILEVHHLAAPVGGRKRYGLGHWNHQDRLTVLCTEHHDFETRLERMKPGQLVQLELPVAS